MKQQAKQSFYKIANMKKWFFLLAITATAISCGGKNKQATNTDAPTQTDSVQQTLSVAQIKWNDSDVAAVAFIGYYKDTEKATAAASREYDVECRWVEAEGNECYLIIPRSPEATIQVNKYDYDAVEDKETVGKTLYEAVGAPILLRCNISDFQANARVTITLNGKKAVFEPHLSLLDGTTSLPGVTSEGQGSVLDATNYKWEYGENEDLVTFEADPSHEIMPEAHLKNGRVMLIIDPEQGEKMYKNNGGDDEFYIDDNPHVVQGLEGICQKIFFGNWGNNVSPLLCMLLDDGEVEILDINNAVFNNDFMSSGRLPDLSNIVSFKQYKDEDGYMVKAIDKDGKSHDINLYYGSKDFYHFEKDENVDVCYELHLSPDWKMHFKLRVADEFYKENYAGRFRGKPMPAEGETTTYTYEMLNDTHFADDARSAEDIATDDISQKGSFTIKKIKGREDGVRYEIKAVSGKIKFNNNSGPIFGLRDVNPFSQNKQE